jgi:hypothetical protein
LRDKTAVRGLVPVFKRVLTAATEEENLGGQGLASFSQARLTRSRRINALVVRYTLR